MARPNRFVTHGLPLGAALGTLLLHSWLLSGWIVDDAGITFAYAKNLANGYGLVAQPGHTPVEGFSNPLWTLLIAGLYAVGVFDVQVAPKLVGVALAAGVIGVVWWDLRNLTHSPMALAIPLVLLAACSPFVIWTTSGLENGLLAFLVVLAVQLALAGLGRGHRPTRDMAAGAVAALAALTRPDAIVYAALYPCARLLALVRHEPSPVLGIGRDWLRFGAGFVPIYGGYLVFRLRYFEDVVPNTYYAKQKPSLLMASPGKLLDLWESASGDFLAGALLWAAFGLALLVVSRRLTARLSLLFGALAAATAVFLVMPPDWMGEYRFATVFYPLFFWSMTNLSIVVATLLPTPVRSGLQVAVVPFVGQLAIIFMARTLVFAEYPTVPLNEVQAYGGRGFNALADTLPGARANQLSLLTPDLGGALLESRLRVHDLAGLCDRRIARALAADNPAAIQDYIFDELKPTFIHTHGAFTRAARVSDDPRFARDYAAIHEHVDGPPSWSRLWPDRQPPAWAGDYVRRDVLGTDGLATIQATYRREQLDAFVPWLRPADRLREGWPQVQWAGHVILGHLQGSRTRALSPAWGTQG